MKYLCIILRKCRQLLEASPTDPHRGAARGACWGGDFRPSEPSLPTPGKNPAGSHVYFSCMSCIQDFTFLNINLTTCRMSLLYFGNSTFDIVVSWQARVTVLFMLSGSDQVGSDRVGTVSDRVGSELCWVGSGQIKLTRGMNITAYDIKR